MFQKVKRDSDRIIKLIEGYRKYECLWVLSNKKYKCRNAKKDDSTVCVSFSYYWISAAKQVSNYELFMTWWNPFSLLLLLITINVAATNKSSSVVSRDCIKHTATHGARNKSSLETQTKPKCCSNYVLSV